MQRLSGKISWEYCYWAYNTGVKHVKQNLIKVTDNFYYMRSQ